MAKLHDRSRQLVSKESIGRQHAGMVAAAKNFQVRATGQRGIHPQDDLARTGLRQGDAFQTQVFRAVQHRCQHGLAHLPYSRIPSSRPVNRATTGRRLLIP